MTKMLFLTPQEVAGDFRVTTQTVRNWIRGGRLLAVQPKPRGAFRIPEQAVVALKEQIGMLPAFEMAVPPAPPVAEYESADALYQGLISPALEEMGCASMADLVGRLEREPDLYPLCRGVLSDFGLYLSVKAEESAFATA